MQSELVATGFQRRRDSTRPLNAVIPLDSLSLLGFSDRATKMIISPRWCCSTMPSVASRLLTGSLLLRGFSQPSDIEPLGLIRAR